MAERPLGCSERVHEGNEVVDERNNYDLFGCVDVYRSEEDDIVKPSNPEPMYENTTRVHEHKNLIELEDVPGVGEVESEEHTEHTPARKRDSGWGWVVLAAAFIISVCIDGVALSFFLLRDKFVHDFNASQAKTSLIGSMFIALPLLTGPIMSALVDRYGCKVITIIAGLGTTSAFLLAAVSNSVPMLCLTYGVIGGVAVGNLYVTCVVSVALWFNERRHLAVSLLSCSFGIGPLIFSHIIEHFLNVYNLLDTMLMIGGILLHVCICGALMRNPPSLEMEHKKKMRLPPKRTKSLSSTSSLSSRPSNESNSKLSAEVPINMKHQVECETNPAVIPVLIEPKKPTTSGSEENEKGSKDKISVSKPILNENTGREIHTNKLMQLRNWCKGILSDHNYLKSIILYKNNIVYRGAMTSIPKYRLRSTLRPNVYGNSCWSLTSETTREEIPFLRIWKTPEDISDHIPTFTRTRFIMFNLCTFNACAWSLFPYFFLKSFMDENAVAGGTLIISIISIATVIGTVFYNWAGQQEWMNVMVAYRTCLILCGFSLIAYSHIITYYWVVVIISLIFGITVASCHTFTSTILMDLMPMDKFTMGYCIVLLAQGVGYLIGPPLGGMLRDVTGTWNSTFLLGGIGLILAGICACLVPMSNENNSSRAF